MDVEEDTGADYCTPEDNRALLYDMDLSHIYPDAQERERARGFGYFIPVFLCNKDMDTGKIF